MKQVCPRSTGDKKFYKRSRESELYGTIYKCHNTEEYYWNNGDTVTALCSDDPHYYQACGYFSVNNYEVTNGTILCGEFLCGMWGGFYFSSAYFIICNGVYDCANTKLDEEGCSEKEITIMPSTGEKLASNRICNDVCDATYCEDEATCNGYSYGMYCDNTYRPGTVMFIPPGYICDGDQHCDNGEDEAQCTVTNETQYTCEHHFSWTRLTVPVHNFTRCSVLDDSYYYLYKYCSDYASYQTNCSDPAKVGVRCLVNGYLSSVSNYMICLGETAICDDNFENQCIQTSSQCTVHRHLMCDDQPDCNDKSDETDRICITMTLEMCERRVGQKRELPMPLAWLRDGVKDCLNGIDEDEIWPTCGSTKSLRHVISNNTCENVYLCPWGEPGYVEFSKLCDGVETCGNENKICSESRKQPKLSTTVLTTDKRLVKHLSYCIKGIKGTQNFKNHCFTISTFRFTNVNVYGGTNTTVIMPNVTENCDHMFGEQYLYTSCAEKCINSSCPLKNVPRYEACPGQYHNRIATIANNKFLTFVTKSYGNIYTNRFFVCDNNITCIDYSQVCNLIDDCGDGSDEDSCTNNFKCDGSYIPVTKKCDGSFDCLDLTDECNNQCSRQILEGNAIKFSSWVIGFLAVLANLIILSKNTKILKKCKTTVALFNKSLIMMISFGDLLVGIYLLVISIYDGVIFKEEYCTQQIRWITSIQCSIIGVLSTIGSQVSLFAMCALSLTRIYGIHNSMRIPGEVTLVKSLQVTGGVLMMTLASIFIAVIPIISKFEDFFVNGVKYAEEIKVFIGTMNKQTLFAVFQGYFGRMKETTLSWHMINKMMSEMYSHDNGYEDHTKNIQKVDFYGNDGVCLFKYFVKENDPQRHLVWAILSLNFVCFFFITASYLIIGIISHKSSKSLTLSGGNQQINQRNRKMNLRITIIITTDFLCWVPFIVICVLHSLEVLDATPWYGLFSMIILPINSVINPLIYDDTVTNLIIVPIQRLGTQITDSRIYRELKLRLQRSSTVDTIELDCVTGQDGEVPGTAEMTGVRDNKEMITQL